MADMRAADPLQQNAGQHGGIRPNPHPLIDLVIVDDGPDAADIWIAGTVAAGDIVVTNDIPLAAKCVAGDSRVLRPDGSAITAGRSKPFSKADRGRFSQALDQLLSRRS